MSISDKQTDFLYAHLDDMAGEASRGIFRASAFFTPAELVLVRRWISSRGGSVNARIWGGYADAERARVYFLPDYMTEGADALLPELLSCYGYDDPTVLLKISGSGFRKLSHRDFMGTVLSLGIERDVVGDIVADGDCAAYVFVDFAIADYVCENLKKISNDAARAVRSAFPDAGIGGKRYKELRDTVASLRIDAIVASACNLSRETAKKTVAGGLCELNYELAVSPDATLCAGDVFSVRGYGKYKLAALDGENARGRLRVVIHKYI